MVIEVPVSLFRTPYSVPHHGLFSWAKYCLLKEWIGGALWRASSFSEIGGNKEGGDLEA